MAFPAISCGVYAYPIKDAARIAVETCMAFSDKVRPSPCLSRNHFPSQKVVCVSFEPTGEAFNT